jgi:phosphatidylinositol kinase/protein kinase (PI-3  family)
MQLLRDHKDSLMSVLDAFIHDPLVEWEDQRRKMVLHCHALIPTEVNNHFRNVTGETMSDLPWTYVRWP